MVIAHLLNDDGGVGRVAETLCNAQALDGHKVYVITSKGNQKFLANLNPKVEVVLLSEKTKLPQILSGLQVSSVYQQLRQKHPKETIILHAHNLVSVGLFSRLRNLPLICTIHGLSKFPGTKETFRSRLQTISLSIIIRRILRFGGVVCGVSEHTSKHYSEVSGRKIPTIHNGTDEKSSSCTVSTEAFNIVHIGDISREKGWDCALAACSILKQQFPQKTIRFISAGRLCNLDETTVSELISSSGLNEDEVVYLGFIKNPDEIYLKAHAFVLASDSEGLPMAVLEAQSFGVPVIATPVGGCPEVIKNGVNGFIVSKDPSYIADKLASLIDDNDKWLSLSKNSKQNHAENFSSKVMIDKYYRSYETIGVKYDNR